MTSRQPRVLVPILATVAAIIAAVWGAVLPAAAGGPTSVLLVNPVTGIADALYYSDAAYEQLGRAVGTDGSDAGSASPPEGADTDAEIRLTWMIHDMSVWRIDRMHRTQDGWWIQTLTSPSGGDPFDGPGRWHRPADQPALDEVLQQAGLLEDSGQAADRSGDALNPRPADPAPTPSSEIGRAHV